MSEGAIGWDDEVSVSDAGEQKKSELVTLPDGTYRVTVNKVERGNHPGSEKLGPCGMVKLGVVIDGGERGNGYATTRFFMHTKMLFRIFELMEALKLRQKGDKTSATIPWDKVEKGMTCMAKVKTREYNGKTSNEIVNWMPEEDDMPEF